MTREDFQKKYLIFIILILFTVLYTLTLYPGVGGRVYFGDSAKWQFLWYVGGTPHSTGYPLFLFITTFFGKVLFFLDPALRITLISLIFAIATLFILYKISEIYISTLYARFIPSILLGSSYIFWAQATEAEVYTLNAFFVALVIYFLVQFHTSKHVNFLLTSIAIYALSFGNHLTMIFLLPAFLYIIFSTDYKLFFNKKVILLSILFLSLGASQYLYLLYLSHTGSSNLEYIGKDASIQHWFSYITGGQFREAMGAHTEIHKILSQGKKFTIHFIQDIAWTLPLMLVFFIPRLKVLKIFKDKTTIALILIGFFQLANALTYNITDIYVYYIPIYLVFALLISKTIDYLESHKQKNYAIILIYIFSSIIIYQNFQNLYLKNNEEYSKLENIFEYLPVNSTLYIPKCRQGFYKYHGFHALKYAQYIDYDNKQITHIQDISHQKEFYVPSQFLSYIDETSYKLTPINNELNLLSLLVKHRKDLIIIVGKKEVPIENGFNSVSALSKLGLSLNELQFGEAFVAIIKNSKTIDFHTSLHEPINFSNQYLNEVNIKEINSFFFPEKEVGNYFDIIFKNRKSRLYKGGLTLFVIGKDGIKKRHHLKSKDPMIVLSNVYKATKISTKNSHD